LAFYKVNDRPFIVVVEHAFGYFFGNKLYLWKQRTGPSSDQIAAGKANAVANSAMLTTLGVPKLSNSKLKDLSWSLNIKDRTSAGVVDAPRSGFEI